MGNMPKDAHVTNLQSIATCSKQSTVMGSADVTDSGEGRRATLGNDEFVIADDEDGIGAATPGSAAKCRSLMLMNVGGDDVIEDDDQGDVLLTANRTQNELTA